MIRSGIAAYGLGGEENVTSNNVLGRGLSKQLKANEANTKLRRAQLFEKLHSNFALGIGLLVFLRAIRSINGYSTATI